MGLLISKYFHTRQKFFRELCQFCENLNLKISYSKTKLEEIIKKEMQNASEEFALFLEQYLRFLMGEIAKEDFFCVKTRFLSSEERDGVFNFFASLGEMAKEEEMEKISFHKKTFEKISGECDKSTKKFSSLYFKLCIVFGLFLVVIFI